MTRYSVHVVCRPEVALGFALAGVPAAAAENVDDARRIITELAAREDAGVLLVQEELLGPGATESARADHRAVPMIVPFPGPERIGLPGRAEAYVADILRQAIGYRVRLR